MLRVSTYIELKKNNNILNMSIGIFCYEHHSSVIDLVPYVELIVHAKFLIELE